MNDFLKSKIDIVRAALEANPASIVIGQIRKGNSYLGIQSNRLQDYLEFLKECDGASFGDIDFFPSKELEENQFYLQMLPGGEEDWLCIGLILYHPLVINKNNSQLYRICRDRVSDLSLEHFGNLDDFLMDFTLGERYSEVIPLTEGDEWYALLNDSKLI